MSEVSKTFIKKEFGICALNQLDECAHTVTKKDLIIIQYTNDDIPEEFGVAKTPDGIAGGALFINRKAWDKVKGYRVLGVYAGDDAYLIHDIARAGLITYVSYTLDVIHPREKDSEYRKLKFKALSDDTLTGSNLSKDKYDSIIQKHEDFWKEENNKI
jgi:hypothetical protein